MKGTPGRLLGLCLMLAAAPAFAGSTPANEAASKPQASSSYEGRIAYGRLIPLDSRVRVPRDSTVNLYWVTFHKEGGSVRADVRLTLLSYPKGAWRVDLDTYTLSGRRLARASGVFANSGTIISVPSIEEGNLRLVVGPPPEGSVPWRFRLRLTEVPAATEPTLRLSHDGIWPEPPFPDMRQPEGGRVVETDVVDAAGKPVPAEVTVWRALDGPPPEEPPSVLRDRPVHWRSGKTTWVPVLHTGPGRIDGLPPALYRISAARDRTRTNSDPTPAGETGIVDLRDGPEVRKVTLRLPGAHPLAVRIVDATTGKPLAGQQVLLFRWDGLPVADGSKGFHMAADAAGIARFAALEPGRYRLEVGPRNWASAAHPGLVKAFRIDVPAAGGKTVEIPYGPAR